jgi:antirestriction protein ArdC
MSPCRYGHIVPHGDMILAATTDSIRIGQSFAWFAPSCTKTTPS